MLPQKALCTTVHCCFIGGKEPCARSYVFVQMRTSIPQILYSLLHLHTTTLFLRLVLMKSVAANMVSKDKLISFEGEFKSARLTDVLLRASIIQLAGIETDETCLSMMNRLSGRPPSILGMGGKL